MAYTVRDVMVVLTQQLSGAVVSAYGFRDPKKEPTANICSPILYRHIIKLLSNANTHAPQPDMSLV